VQKFSLAKQVEKNQLTEQERKAAIQHLKGPDLLTWKKQAIAQSGLVGRRNEQPDRLPDPYTAAPNVSGRKAVRAILGYRKE
jgi:hypothetical protein